jgi:hypothetical protein
MVEQLPNNIAEVATVKPNTANFLFIFICMLSKTFNIQIKYRSTKIKQSAKRYFYQLFCYKTLKKALKTSKNDVDTLHNFKSPFPTRTNS